MSKSPSHVIKRLNTQIMLAQGIIDNLQGGENGNMSWSNGGMKNYVRMLREMGITLVTKTQAKKMGYRMKRGAQPVASGYFTAPISQQCDLYVLECQFVWKGKNE